MRNLLLTIFFVSMVSLSGFGQYNLDYGFSVGASNYLGDIGGGEATAKAFVYDMKLGATRWNLGGFVRYKIANRVALKTSLNYIRLSADDSKTANPARRARNLNFKNDMFELQLVGEFYVYRANDVGGTGRYDTDFNLYLFGGVAGFYSNPKGQDVSGEWVSLKPLSSEGASYSNINLAVPLGVGFYYTLQRKYRLGLEFGWRTTFTDYIDDVSDTYANDYDGITNKTREGLLSEINNEYGDEILLLNTNFDAGSKRGNPDNNDSYMTITANFSWAIRGKSKFYKSSHSWVLGKKNRRRRKSRAKF